MPLHVSSRARMPQSARVASLGQSLAAMDFYSPGNTEYNARMRAICAAAGVLPDGVEVGRYARGGSYGSRVNMLADEATIGTPDFFDDDPTYQTDDTGGTPVDGDLLASFIPAMTARAVGNKIQHLCVDQGQADAQTVIGISGRTPAQAIASWTAAWEYALGRYISATEVPASCKAFWRLLGRHISSATIGTLAYERMRQAQLRLIADHGLIKCGEAWDLSLADSVHPDEPGEIEKRKRDAEAQGKALFGITSYSWNGATVTIYDGPTIASVTKTDSTHVRVIVTPQAGDAVSYPAGIPCGFRFGDAAANWSQTFNPATNPVPVLAPSALSRSGNTLDFTLPAPIAGSIKMFFPFDDVPDFAVDRVIRGAVSGKPLQSWASGV